MSCNSLLFILRYFISRYFLINYSSMRGYSKSFFFLQSSFSWLRDWLGAQVSCWHADENILFQVLKIMLDKYYHQIRYLLKIFDDRLSHYTICHLGKNCVTNVTSSNGFPTFTVFCSRSDNVLCKEVLIPSKGFSIFTRFRVSIPNEYEFSGV